MKTFAENTSGNVGLNQPVDSIRNVVWNMPADWSVTYGNISVEALAKDTRNLMGIHWITVPASNGEPAIQVSYDAIEESDLYHLWLWLLATNQEISITRSVPVSTATITGTSGIYNGALLSEYYPWTGQITSQAGRVFALKKMGARPITEAELLRARGGNYGFSSNIQSSYGTRFIVKDDTVPASYIKAAGYRSDFRGNLQTFSTNTPVSIDAGYSHVLLLRSDGSLWGYGDNSYGQLGLGHATAQSAPVKIADGVAQFSAGSYHSVFIKTDGSLWAMGRNNEGQLGNNSTTQSNIPVQIATAVRHASAGDRHTLFVKTNRTLWAMGSNNYGQLGDGTNTSRLSPVQITNTLDYNKVEAAGDHSFFLKSNSSLWATGRNDYGQLGLAAGSSRNTPIQVLANVAAVSSSPFSGAAHTLCVMTDATLWACGYNGCLLYTSPSPRDRG